jgi:hypothetical protein
MVRFLKSVLHKDKAGEGPQGGEGPDGARAPKVGPLRYKRLSTNACTSSVAGRNFLPHVRV